MPPLAPPSATGPSRVGGPAPFPSPPRRRLGLWLLLSLALHAGALLAASTWLSDRERRWESEPIPISWVRVEAAPAEPSTQPGSAIIAPAPAPAELARPKRPARPRPEPEARPVGEAPQPAATPLAEPTETVSIERATPPAEPALEAQGDAAGTGAAPSGTADVASAGPAGEVPGSPGTRSSGSQPGFAPAGWMPRGGAQPRPQYPESARKRGVEGVSHVALRLAASGRIGEARIHRSAGDPRLDDAALAAVRRWRFDPPPAEVGSDGPWFVVPIEFRLR